MADRKATAVSCSNIAFIKYWGNRDAALRLPANDSLSMNLEALTIQTTVLFNDGLPDDQITIGDEEAQGSARDRLVKQLDRIRTRAQLKAKARVVSRGNFPQSTGLASSASGFAAMTLAAVAAAGLELDERALSVLARQGSGSAARSIPGGFVEWIASSASETSFAHSIAPPDYWDLQDVVVITTRNAKKTSSSDGHLTASTSPYFSERLSRLPARFHRTKHALLARDLVALGPELEAEAIELHFIAMTSRPPIYYWSPEMVRVIEAARAWREGGLQVYYTLDAGSNVHLICQGKDAEAVATNARAVLDVQQVIVSRPGGPCHLVEDHLF